ncbi:XrtA/PEP-CTERM system histidine kinase PrsK [Alteraurantiacibacter buctensis]|uniref:histidine kinase n=1 Tax=Alteraurantiacibacter buctensis TaxID=1503981 RepID=A0A844YZZ2_9SPHN|nr:XrtA/PEP-CTERM system histidine kinase PrsK [Alteraurantiacibacter buctensis]MXO71657.1 PEP-CTERM system histidine kinase PrsK [Alteraurantiacibacter buctensis]
MSGALWTLLVTGAHLLAATAAILLALVHASQKGGERRLLRRANLALALSALWALAGVGYDGRGSELHLLLGLADLAWLWLLAGFFASDERDKSIALVSPLIHALALVETAQIAIAALRLPVWAYGVLPAPVSDALFSLSVMFQLLFCIGALVLVHNLYVGAAQPARQGLRWPAAALAVLWLYDLNLYTITYLADRIPAALEEGRALALLVVVALLGIGTLGRRGDLRFQPSRSFAFRSFSLAVIGAYLVVMVLIAQAIAYTGNDMAKAAQIGFVVIASAIALAVVPSRRVRGWLRVTLTKHLFQHRYDYRAEWLRFTDTIGRAGPQAISLHERAVQAVADIADSPSGLLLTPREEGGLAVDARWNWRSIEVPAMAMDAAAVRFFEERQYIVDLDDLRAGRKQDIPECASPAWLLANPDAWAMVPLLHFERLVGMVILARPPVARMLDWEDFDLLRVIGRQLASYLAEQTSQDALGEAQRFDEFNRRIAFVMHDIKNLASQLSLLARNAEKHADKPAFRADMILTLKNSTDKLQNLLARLSRYGSQGGAGLQDADIDLVLQKVTRQFFGKHELVMLDRAPCVVRCDPEALEQALVHLVQNAIEAGPENSPVFLDLRVDASGAHIEVIDNGCGMSPEFIRTRLFKPFHSSKQGGFGIGCFEAREMVRAMGGRLDVESREGIGTRFQITLPLDPASGLIETLRQQAGPATEVA